MHGATSCFQIYYNSLLQLPNNNQDCHRHVNFLFYNVLFLYYSLFLYHGTHEEIPTLGSNRPYSHKSLECYCFSRSPLIYIFLKIFALLLLTDKQTKTKITKPLLVIRHILV